MIKIINVSKNNFHFVDKKSTSAELDYRITKNPVFKEKYFIALKGENVVTETQFEWLEKDAQFAKLLSTGSLELVIEEQPKATTTKTKKGK
jgi:hypothetical protein